jgi:hypothetical protein
MLNSNYIDADTTWNRLQQPAHASQLPSEYMRLLSALDEGWIISEAALLLASGRNAEGRGYQLTLIHREKPIMRELVVAQSLKMDALLEYEGVPTAI